MFIMKGMYKQVLEEFIGRLGESVEITKLFMKDFEIVYKDVEFKTNKNLPLLVSAYFYTTLLHFSKIVSRSQNEFYRFEKLKILFPSLSHKVDSVFKNHGDLISKINTNRDWLFAHTDPKFTKLKASHAHVTFYKEKFGIDLSFQKANSKSEERYRLIDMEEDMLELKEILCEIEEVQNEIANIIYTPTYSDNLPFRQ